MAGTYPDTFTFSVTFTKGEQPVITVRGYNQADLFTESDPVTFATAFIDQEKLPKRHYRKVLRHRRQRKLPGLQRNRSQKLAVP